jgi:hypothetical protein
LGCFKRALVNISCWNDGNKWLVGLLKRNRLSDLLNKKSSLAENIDLLLKVRQSERGVFAVWVVGAEDDWGVIEIVRAAAVGRRLRPSTG